MKPLAPGNELFTVAFASLSAASLAGLGAVKLLPGRRAQQASLGVASLTAGAAAWIAWSKVTRKRAVLLEREQVRWHGPALRIGLVTGIGGQRLRSLREVVERLNDELPDLVLLEGDIPSQDGSSAALRAWAPLSKIRAPLGVYALLSGLRSEGADALQRGALAARLGLPGVDIINSARRDLTRGISLIGIDEYKHAHFDVARVFRSLPVWRPTIVLCRSWRSLLAPGVGRFDIALCGPSREPSQGATFSGFSQLPAPDARPGLYHPSSGGVLYVRQSPQSHAQHDARWPDVTVLSLTHAES